MKNNNLHLLNLYGLGSVFSILPTFSHWILKKGFKRLEAAIISTFQIRKLSTLRSVLPTGINKCVSLKKLRIIKEVFLFPELSKKTCLPTAALEKNPVSTFVKLQG